jgi:hypothetical protein
LIEGSSDIGLTHGIVIVYAQRNMGRVAKEGHGWLFLEPLDIAPKRTKDVGTRMIASK